MAQKENEELKAQMITEAMVIIASVGFLEKQINEKLSLLEEAVNNGYAEDVKSLDRQVLALVKKVGRENRNMDSFMEKYGKAVRNEKKTILSGA